MKLKTLKLISIIVSFILCFPLHFLYNAFPNFLTSIIAPVNESIVEHMKILFTSIILTGVLQKIIVSVKKLDFKNICISNFVGAILSIPIFLMIFLPIYYSLGENFIINIIIMLIAIIFSQIISYLIIKKKPLKLENKTIFFVTIIYIIFALLTYYPPKIDLFLDPINLYYGIKNN